MEILHKAKLAGVDVKRMKPFEFAMLLLHLDTKFHQEANTRFYYMGGIGGHAGVYYGKAINYIGVGQGFSARGYTPMEMQRDIIPWKVYRFGNTGELFKGGEFGFALAGYDFYLGHK